MSRHALVSLLVVMVLHAADSQIRGPKEKLQSFSHCDQKSADQFQWRRKPRMILPFHLWGVISVDRHSIVDNVSVGW